MNEKKIIILTVASSLVILFGGIFFLTKTTVSPEVTASQEAKVFVESKEYDWGTFPYKSGNKTKTFKIKNAGTGVLKLLNVKTSCHCTKAYVTILGNESPTFGMSGFSSWVGEVPPGKEAELTVIFDPLYHGLAGVGPLSRFVSLDTNDGKNLKMTFTLTGNVTKE